MHDLKIFTDLIEPSAVNQVYELISTPAFEGAKVRVMPDAHSGTGCVVGFTSTSGEKVVPGVIGGDIGCGMLTAMLGKVDIDYPALDDFIKSKIPAGSGYSKTSGGAKFTEKLICKNELRDLDRLYGSLGTLGGGNHFIEIDVDKAGNKYLIIHSGSRNLGLQVAKIYAKRAVSDCKNAALPERNAIITELTERGEPDKIPDALKKLTEKHAAKSKLRPEHCFLEGNALSAYMHDMRVCRQFAAENRRVICEKITKFLKIQKFDVFESIHNYVDDAGIIRKGAIAAHAGQKLIIPLNMRDGCLLCEGLGNADWNYSAPHGAGRLYGRGEAKRLFTAEEFAEKMKGVYTTTANASTIDESPMAYKPMEQITERIKDTVKIIDRIFPEYNFKAADGE